MISKEEFFKMFEGCDVFTAKELRSFYASIRPSVAIIRCGYKRTFFRIDKMEKKIQWEFWKKIYENDLFGNIARTQLAGKLFFFIEFEKEMISKKNSHPHYQWAIYERIKLYPKIFKFDEMDEQWIKKISASYEKILSKKISKKRLLFFGAAAIGGAAAWYGGNKIYEYLKDNKK